MSVSVRPRRAMRASATAFAFLFGGCTVGPDWNIPLPAGPTEFQHPAGQLAPSQTTSTPVNPEWWDIFHDAELSSLERRVAKSNLDLAEATALLGASRAERQIVRADRYPSSDFNASYARERASPNGVLALLGTTEKQDQATIANGSPGFGPAAMPGSSGSAPFDLWQYGFDASWELDLWGRVRRGVEAADAAVEASENTRRGILVSILAETARDYLQLRGIQAQIAITMQNLDLAKRSLELTRLRFKNGATTNLDVANASAQLASINAHLPALQKQEAQLINALSLLLDREPRSLDTELATAKVLQPVPPHVPIGLPSELARRRPDIRAAEARLHQTTAEIGIAVADFYPRITLSGSLDIQALQFSGLGSWASRQYGLGPSVSLPIFEGGRLHGTLELRKEQQRQAAIAYRHTVLRAWHEVDDALTAYNAVQTQRDHLKQAVEQSQTAFRLAQNQYEQGACDFLNVLTVQNQLLSAQSALAQATTDTHIALASLYKALGGGWEQQLPVERVADVKNPLLATSLASTVPQ